MSNLPVNFYFEYDGYYKHIGGDDYEWIRENVDLKGLSFPTMKEITYSVLVESICSRLVIDESTSMKLSYIPPNISCSTQVYISDDVDVYIYLTSLDKDQRRSVLHVEFSEDVVKLIALGEGRAMVEKKKSSVGKNYEGLISGNNIDGTAGIMGNTTEEQSCTLPEPMNLICYGENEVDNVVDHIVDVVVDHTVDVAVDDKLVDHGVDVAVDDDVDKVVDHGVDVAVDDEVDNSRNCEIVELPRHVKDSQFVKAWEDGMGLVLHQEFDCKKTVTDIIEKAATLNCFGYNIVNSDTKKFVIKCREAGKGCKWYLRVAKVKSSKYLSVRVYNKMHTCSRVNASLSSSSRRKRTPRLVASILQEDYPGKFDTPTPKTIISLAQGRVGAEVSYSTALRGKKLALSEVRGSPVDCFKMLPSYLHMLEEVNPGTKTRLELDDLKRFKYLFVALGLCIEGFQAMRKVLIVDATFLKSGFSGTLIFATAQDPNRHHYPIAFAVVDGENKNSWTWFFETLKTVIPDSTELVFVSDRNKSLLNAVAEVYPLSQHGYCIFHLGQNLRCKVSNVNKEAVAEKFRKIATIYSEAEFEEEYANFKAIYPAVGKYLEYEEEDGSKRVDVAKWARCYFKGLRYNIDITNCAESMNAIFKTARGYSLLPMIDAIIAKWSEWFNLHRKDSVVGSDVQKLVPYVENVLHDRCGEARKLSVCELNTFQLEYVVDGRDGKKYVVDLRYKTCTCKCFDIDKYPCVHAIAATMKFLDNDTAEDLRNYYDLCSKYYLVETWALAYYRTMYPVPHMSEWIIPDHIKCLFAFPPVYKKRKGITQEKRFPSVGESRRKNKSVRGRNLGKWFEPVRSDSAPAGPTASARPTASC